MSSIYRIAILGATSQIAKDLVVSFSADEDKHLHLFARRPDEVTKWRASVGLPGRYALRGLSFYVAFAVVLGYWLLVWYLLTMHRTSFRMPCQRPNRSDDYV